MSSTSLEPPPRDPRQPADFDPVGLGKMLLRSARIAMLATLDPATGFPFASLVNIATDLDGAPLILVSGLSAHTKNLQQDARVSLLISASGQNARAEKGDPMAHPRLTLQARTALVRDPAERERVRARFLARHPKAAIYADFGDFGFFRLNPETMHLNGGFARAFDGDARHILAPIADAAGFAALEQTTLAALNAQSATLAALVPERGGKPGSGWRAAALDPDGLDLMRGDEVTRLAFPVRITDQAGLEAALDTLKAGL